jgi:uncharacterized protein
VSAARLGATLLIFSALLGLGHYYLWNRMFRSLAWPKRPTRFGGVAIAALGLSLPLTFATARTLPREQIEMFAFPAFLWLGFASTYFVGFLITDIGRGALLLLRRAVPSAFPEDPARRLFFQRLFAGGVVFSGTWLSVVSAREALSQVQVKRVDVFLRRLPPEFDGFRIAQISDIHIGPTLGREFLHGLVQLVNELAPNLVAITGDLVDGTVEHLARHTEPLATLKATDGVYFVTGNHEYYSGVEEWVAELARLGIPTLRNSRIAIARGTASLDVAGVTDHRAASFGDAPDFAAALRGRDPERELILLAHQPAAAFEAARYGVGLQLSGHTHGGQFWPWTWVIHFIQPVVRGLAKIGSTQVYVNTGTGYWGPPLRFQTPPEITEIRLRAAV